MNAGPPTPSPSYDWGVAAAAIHGTNEFFWSTNPPMCNFPEPYFCYPASGGYTCNDNYDHHTATCVTDTRSIDTVFSTDTSLQGPSTRLGQLDRYTGISIAVLANTIGSYLCSGVVGCTPSDLNNAPPDSLTLPPLSLDSTWNADISSAFAIETGVAENGPNAVGMAKNGPNAVGNRLNPTAPASPITYVHTATGGTPTSGVINITTTRAPPSGHNQSATNVPISGLTNHTIQARSANLEKRISKPVTYAQAVCKGTQILAMIPTGNTPQSTITSYNSLAQNGYFAVPLDEMDDALNPVFSQLGVTKANFQRFSMALNPPDGTRQVKWQFYINVAAGILVVEFAKGPINPLPAQVPQRLSDITFLAWQYFCQKQSPPANVGSSLKYIIHRMVSNQSTQQIAASAAQKAQSQLSAWPGTRLTPTSEPGKAMIGSPNGYGVGFLLASHHAIFGTKTYASVTIFNDAYGDLGIVYALGSPPPQARAEITESVLSAFAPDTLSLSVTPTENEPYENSTVADADPSLYRYYDARWEYGEAEGHRIE